MKSLRSSRYHVLAALLAALTLPLSVSNSPAQTITTGDLTGTIADASGAVVPNANISLKSLDTGVAVTATSEANGSYRFNFLKPGNYELSASTSGLHSDLTQVSITVGQVATTNLTLKVEEAKQVVLVTDAAPLIQADNANLAATFNQTQILDLPAPGSDITTVAFTVPGITVNTGSGYGNFSTHGLPGTSNLFTINGNDYNDPYLNLNNSGASNLLLGQNEVQEVSVVQNAYSVQYGRNAGAQINYITKSGTNAFHGSVLYNWNGALLNANDFFNNLNGLPKPHAVSNNWGAAFGGPIKRNKLFFFADNEGLRYVLPFGGVVAYPSPQFQNYILGTIQPQSVGLYKAAFSEFSGAAGSPVTTGNAPTQDATGTLGCGSFAGTPNTVGGGTFGVNVPCAYSYATNANNLNQEWLQTGRLDWNISDKERLFIRYKVDHGRQPTGTNLLNSTYNLQSIQPQDEGQLNLSSTISPTMVNNLTASILWYSAIFTSSDIQKATSVIPVNLDLVNDGGVNAGFFYPVGVGYQPVGFFDEGLQYFPQGRNVGQGEIVDDLSKIVGKHNFKVGVNFRRNRVSDYALQQLSYGVYTFNSVADFAQGIVPNDGSSFEQNFSPASVVHVRLYNVGFYAQDEWAAKSNLKITYGIRFERTGNPECNENCFSILDSPFTSSSFAKGANIPYNQSIKTNLSNAYPSVDTLGFEPRIGIVWKPGKSLNGLVVRTGFGMFADLPPGGLVDSVLENQPYLYSGDVFNGQAAGLPGTPNTAAATAVAEYNAFRTGFANGATFTQLNNSIPGGFSPINFTSVPSILHAPQYLEWSFEVEKPFGDKNVLAVTYAGNHGYNLFNTNPWANTASSTPFGGLPLTTPDPRFNAVSQIETDGVSNYDGLVVQFRRALAWGFSGQAGYTWSHALDDLSSLPGEPYNFANSIVALPTPYLNQNYANSDFDIRQNFVADFVWNAPFKPSNHLVRALVSDWTLSSKFYVRTGTPFTVYDGSLPGLVGGAAVGAYARIAATPIGSPNLNCGSGAVDNPCLSASEFVAPGSETNFGPRNAFRGPGYFDIDTAIFRNISIGEKFKFAFGAQFFNFLNHPNFAAPAADISGPGLGLISGTVGAPTSPYGSFQGSAVNGRVATFTGRLIF